MAGKTIKLFLTEGKPNGLTVAELQQWTGIALACPRSELPKLNQRPEADKPGVYILTGQDEESQLPVAYIGEAENIRNRLREHHRSLDFWDRICFFTQKDDNLTKGHVRYLESRMIQVASDAKRTPLKNGSSPSPANIPLPESDLADMEYFLEQMQMVLPVLGVDLLQPQPVVTAEDAAENTAESPLFEFKARDAAASAKLMNGEFVVLEGSMARKESTASMHAYMEKMRRELLATGVLEEANGEQYRFTKNYAFGSPSTASGVIAGRASNGRKEWKVKDTRQTYGEWDEARLVD
ncbi:GIY-YIG catalytic domain protein [Anaerohalosphaera lusitana]|uniref:GIY-YIG catalytic domain protein n=1 Tax=Anaerohalosphaera lusitana TaxID=1936003 RepID=A0A1U9NJ70_9BACT|nr:GIY-YIG nuclease family protein [Anaerohalosphaera lusitana]AQT67961.1 GIY-YIG catalytic domain protein [Anaerohalosphaera lusitana]